ncbi:MAG: hypothetical protein IJA11_08760 [Oscillospiraceae bacterium]|nr:hypothetical protein [Oscillospiraceae bacterium]
MPSINEVIERVKRTKPNTTEDKDQARWLITLDGRVYEEVTKVDAPDRPPVKEFPEDGDKPLLVDSPYDNVYDLYLQAMICFSLGEYNDYNNIVDQFEKTLRDFKAWWRRSHVPKTRSHIEVM